MNVKDATTVVILDFETSGLSPTTGDRVIEVGAVLLDDGVITGRYQSLINPDFRISSFIERLTGITNTMLATAPTAPTVFNELADFIGDYNLVAHNAAFDQKFFASELDQIDHKASNSFACSLLIARRLFPNAPDHKLATLMQYLRLPTKGNYHRALADAEMTAKLWLRIIHELKAVHNLDQTTFPFMRKLSRMPVASIPDFLHKQTKAPSCDCNI